MRGRRAPTALEGSTLIELMIALTLLVIVGAGATLASQRGLAVVRTSSARSELIARGGRSLDRVMRELIAVGGTTLGPSLVPPGTPTVWSESLEFRCATDWAASAVVWGPLNRIAFETADGELENGVDDDGDGLVDEGSIVLVRDVGGANEQRVVLATGIAPLLADELANGLDDNGNGLVDERGLCFDRAGGSLNVRISVAGAAPDGGVFVMTLEDSMDVRN